MRVMAFLTILLIGVPVFSQAPESGSIEESILAIASVSKYEASVQSKITQIASLGRDALPAIHSLLDDENAPIPLLITILGFMVSVEDEESVRILEEVATSENEAFRREALVSLLRIGGQPAQQVIASLLDERDESVREDIASRLWELRDTADLEYTYEMLSEAAEQRADTSFAQTLRNSTLPRLAAVIEIRRDPESPATTERLIDMVSGQATDFTTVTGGVAQFWALHMIAESAPENSLPTLSLALQEMESAPGEASMMIEGLQVISHLGGDLTEEQLERLDSDVPRTVPLILTLNADDLRIYE